jgi:hypothetical protein
MSTFENRLYGIGGLISAGIGAYQASNIHHKTVENDDYLHHAELKLIKEQHQKEIATAKQTYLLSTFTDIEQYCQELNENLLNSSRDAERDMVDQRNQQFQTILVASTIMLTALIGVLIQGVLPDGTSTFLVLLYSLSNSSSLLFLGLCILLCIEITRRVSKFMYKKSQANIEHLSDAMRHTRKVMSTIHGSEKSVLSPETDAMLGHNESQTVSQQEAARRSAVARENLRRNSVDDVEYKYTKEEAEARVQANRQANSNALSLKLPQFLPTEDDFPSISDISSNTADKMAVDDVNKTSRQTNFTNSNFADASKRITRLISAISPKSHRDFKPPMPPPPRRQLTTDSSVKAFEQQHARHKITSLRDEDVDAQWSKHEQQIHEYFAARDKINERMELIAVAEGEWRLFVLYFLTSYFLSQDMSIRPLWGPRQRSWARRTASTRTAGTAR